MTQEPAIEKLTGRQLASLAGVVCLFAVLSLIGIAWGLPSRGVDRFLFGQDEPWSGEKILELAGASARFSPNLGADVDIDPLAIEGNLPVPLTDADADVAKIYLRYRLFTHQPDEMITMMALSGMNPRELQLDPRLYQYGGLFIYPVGAGIFVADLLGLIDLRSDVAFYLDNPDEFGKFYLVARGLAALWGIIGVLVVFAIGRRLAGVRAGIFAALLFTLMPVVICMAHEGKPHLQGAVLMLLAVLLAMRQLGIVSKDERTGMDDRSAEDRGATNLARSAPTAAKASPDMSVTSGRRDWWLMAVCCGAAFGTVLSSGPIFVLIPLIAVLRWERTAVALRRTLGGLAVATAVYLATNPYVAINAVSNREVLRSNFGNSLAMYDVTRMLDGLVRVTELTAEGATYPLLGLGMIAAAAVILQRHRLSLPLLVTAVVFFLQFVLIGAGKPGEYGRFGIFTNTALAIGSASLLFLPATGTTRLVQRLGAVVVVAILLACGGLYLRNFHADSSNENSRTREAERLATAFAVAGHDSTRPQLRLTAEPAPYCCPPINFSRVAVLLTPQPDRLAGLHPDGDAGETRTGRGGWSVRAFDRPWPAGTIARIRGGGGSPTPEEFRRFGSPSSAGASETWLDRCPTPISWANKPFEVVGEAVAEEP